MKIEVYCDESYPDLLSSKTPRARYLTIGSLWLEADIRSELKSKIGILREKHNAWGEIKWHKVSSSKLEFYHELVNLFFMYGSRLRFRCIAIDSNSFDNTWHSGDNELGYYKFHYQLLHHWVWDFNSYRIFCDSKTNRNKKRLEVLRNCLNNANLSANLEQIQALPSKQVVLIQLSDLLLGIATARLNTTLNVGGAKESLVDHFERSFGGKIEPTYRSEEKYNVFLIDLKGGW